MTSKLLEICGLKKYFPIRRGLLRRPAGYIRAVDDVSFFVRQRETLGVVGESGCGKTTMARCVLRLIEPTEGSISYWNRAGEQIILNRLNRQELKETRRDIQIVFQDPFSSLDPRMSVFDIISEPLRLHRIGDHRAQAERVAELLELVGLKAYHMDLYPHEFSGGQRQRIGIARALALNPRLVVCDEPVSALDVSVQAQVINLLRDLQEQMGLTYMFIAHDLSVVEHISDRVMVMYLGKVVEIASSEALYLAPKHPYTESLLMAVPIPDPRRKVKRLPLEGAVPDPSNPPGGCSFHTRCPYSTKVCRTSEPVLMELEGEPDRFVACHHASEITLTGWAERLSRG